LGRYRLVWEEKGDRPVDLAWEKSPAGTVTVHPLADTLAYVLSATELPLEELIKVAESMLQD
jgi:hypothetical protein